jgi:hypothetical protein
VRVGHVLGALLAALVDLGAIHDDGRRRDNADPNAIALDGHDRHADATVDDDLLAGPPG